MTDTRISKIKIRTGNVSDIPLLDIAEMGYATDTNSLYVGNPTLTIGTGNGSATIFNFAFPANIAKETFYVDGNERTDVSRTTNSVTFGTAPALGLVITMRYNSKFSNDGITSDAARLYGFTSTATAAGTTTLTNASSQYQLFTGTTTQSIVLPAANTLIAGWTFHIVNNSTGNLTIKTSDESTIVAFVIPNTTAMITCVLASGTTAASWEFGYTDFGSITGTGSVVLNTSPTLLTPALGTPTALVLTNATGLPMSTGVTGTLPLANGGTGVTTAPAAAAQLYGFTKTVTSATPVALTNTSSQYQLFTGTTAQIVKLPLESGLTTGWTFHIVNNSSANLTIQTSDGLTTVATVNPNMTAMTTCIDTVINTASSWEYGFTDFGSITGTGANVLATSPTLVTPALGTPSSGVLTNTTGLPLTTGVTGTLPVGNGGTGAATLTGYVKGTGTTAMTASSTIPNTDVSGLGTMSTQAASSVAITGGSINGATVGATTPSTGAFTTVTASTSVLSTGTGGVGYATGAGGTVTQLTSRTAPVTLSKLSGRITLYSTTTTAGTITSFTVTNTLVAATDTVIVNIGSGATADRYVISVASVSAGAFRIQIHNVVAVGTAEAPVVNFSVIKGVAA